MEISEVVKALMEQIKETVRSETVIGEPVQAEDSVIIPVSKVSFGFGIGGGNGVENSGKSGSGGGVGCGVNIDPVAFVVVSKGKAQLLPLKKSENTVNHLIDLVPSVIDLIKEFRPKEKDKCKEKETTGEDIKQ